MVKVLRLEWPHRRCQVLPLIRRDEFKSLKTIKRPFLDFYLFLPGVDDIPNFIRSEMSFLGGVCQEWNIGFNWRRWLREIYINILFIDCWLFLMEFLLIITVPFQLLPFDNTSYSWLLGMEYLARIFERITRKLSLLQSYLYKKYEKTL
jgi:hypothetical protein